MTNCFRPKSFAAVVTIGIALTCLQHGCGENALDPTKSERTVTKQEDAGSTHVAVLSAAPFDDYRDALQPSFTMSSKDALDQVLPSTLLVEDRILDALKGALKVALPGTSMTETVTTTDATGEKRQRTLERVETTEPGDISNIEFGDSIAADRDITKLAPAESVVKGTPGTDPMLRHLVATALYQEVQLLNRYVRDAARGDGVSHDAYVVRLQVSVLPRTRNLPYDVYTTVSFFNGDFVCADQMTESARAGGPISSTAVESAITRAYLHAMPTTQTALDLSKDLTEPLLANDQAAQTRRASDVVQRLLTEKKASPQQAVALEANLNREFHQEACRVQEGKESAPVVVPLMVTDSIEAALHSQSVDQIRQALLGVSAMIQGVGIGADLEKVDEHIRNVLGRDFNSTFTVGRVSDNTIRVRFGALQNPKMAYNVVPQTHNVTLLLLVPKGVSPESAVRFISRAEFVHARTGGAPKLRTNAEVKKMARKLLEDYGLKANNDELVELAEEAARRVDYNDYKGFEEYVKGKYCHFRAIESLWLDVVNLKGGGRYASGRILLPPVKVPSILAGQNPLVLDDGEKSSVVSLGGVRNLGGTSTLVPLINVQGKAVPATSMTLGEGGARLVMNFPSLKAVGFKIDSANPGLTFQIDATSGVSPLFPARPATYQLTKADQPKSLATISMSAKSVRSAANGTGAAKITLATDKVATITFKIEGAEINAAATKTPNRTVTAGVGKWEVDGPADVELELANLDPATPVTITATHKDDAKEVAAAKVTFTVLPPPPPVEKKS